MYLNASKLEARSSKLEARSSKLEALNKTSNNKQQKILAISCKFFFFSYSDEYQEVSYECLALIQITSQHLCIDLLWWKYYW